MSPRDQLQNLLNTFDFGSWNFEPAMASTFETAADNLRTMGNLRLAAAMKSYAATLFNSWLNADPAHIRQGTSSKGARLGRDLKAFLADTAPAARETLTATPSNVNTTPPPPSTTSSMGFGINDVIGLATDLIPGQLDDRIAAALFPTGGGSSQLPAPDNNPLAGNQAAIDRAKDLLSQFAGGTLPLGPTHTSVPTFPAPPAQLHGYGFTMAKPMQTSKLKAPPGYVIVSLPPNAPEAVYALQNGYGMVAVKEGREVVKFAMRRADAIKRKYWKPAPKPPITATDLRAINRAAAAQRRVAKVAKRAGVSCRTPRKR